MTPYDRPQRPEWIRRHRLQVLFVPAFRLVTQLLAAKGDLKLAQATAKLQRLDL